MSSTERSKSVEKVPGKPKKESPQSHQVDTASPSPYLQSFQAAVSQASLHHTMMLQGYPSAAGMPLAAYPGAMQGMIPTIPTGIGKAVNFMF